MWDSKIGKYRIGMVPIVTLIISIFFISGYGLLQASDMSEAGSKSLDGKQAFIRDKDLELGERMLRSGRLKEAHAAFENVIALDSENVQAHYFLGVLNYEEGDVEKAISRFQIAHDCLNPLSETIPLKIEEKQAQLQFPDSYEARIYRKDDWYIKSKNPSDIDKSTVSLEAKSSYGIEIEPKNRHPLVSRMVIGMSILVSFALIR